MNKINLVSNNLNVAANLMIALHGMRFMAIDVNGKLIVKTADETHRFPLSKTPMMSVDIFKSILATEPNLNMDSVDWLVHTPFGIRLGDHYTAVVSVGDEDILEFEYDAADVKVDKPSSILERMLSSRDDDDELALRLDTAYTMEANDSAASLIQRLRALNVIFPVIMEYGFKLVNGVWVTQFGNSGLDTLMQAALDPEQDAVDVLVTISNLITHTNHVKTSNNDTSYGQRLQETRRYIQKLHQYRIKLTEGQFTLDGSVIPVDLIKAVAKAGTFEEAW